MTDIVTYCDVNTCEDCQRYGDDCDGDKRVEHTDLISRADAIDAVQKIVPYVIDKDTGQWGILVNKANVITELSALPSADAEWIPCSDKLPTEGQGVLVTVDDNVYEIKVGSCIYSNGRFHSLYNDVTVTAWMPLPTPYKGGAK